MKNHINRKKLCKFILADVNPKDHENEIFHVENKNNKICKYCNKEFSRPYTCKIHEKTCKDSLESFKSNEGTSALIELVKTLNEQLSEERKERKEDQKRMEDLVKKAGVTNYNTTNNTTNIVILPYKETDVSHLTGCDYYRALSRCVMSVPQLITDTHFNPNKPENHNIYISNISKGHAMVWDGKKWVIKNQHEIINNLIEENEYRLEDWVKDGSKKYPKAMSKFKTYIEKRDSKGVPEMVRKEVKMMLYNNRNMIQEVD
jgi:hypothetical protein